MNRGEIRLEQGSFVFSCDGVTQPLVYQELQLILLRNCERFMLGEISAEQHETVYARCLDIEKTGEKTMGRRIVNTDADGEYSGNYFEREDKGTKGDRVICTNGGNYTERIDGDDINIAGNASKSKGSGRRTVSNVDRLDDFLTTED